MKTKLYYHATPFSNLNSIAEFGIEPRNAEKLVYLCETAQDCLKFALMHGCRDVLVLECSLPVKEIEETFDHSEAFFKCRCWGISRTIKQSEIKKFYHYEFDGGEK